MNTFQHKFITLSICIFLVLFSFHTSVCAQGSGQGDYLVLYKGDTLYGNVKYIDERLTRTKFYKKIRLTTIAGKRKKYNRKDVSAFRVDNSNYESFWLSQSSQKLMLVNPKYDINSKGGKQHFLKVVSKGKLSHYELEWLEQENSGILSMALLKKEEDPFFIRADQGLLGLKRKVLLNYFFNCPSLREGINQQQLNKVWQIVDFYNKNCNN
jgi:hypothetical protein